MRRTLHVLLVLLLTCTGAAVAAEAGTDVKRIIFEEQRIEGKIRRPQLVLIKADDRPEFQPMIMQSLGRSANIAGSVSEQILDDSPYRKAFRFEGTRINSYVP